MQLWSTCTTVETTNRLPLFPARKLESYEALSGDIRPRPRNNKEGGVAHEDPRNGNEEFGTRNLAVEVKGHYFKYLESTNCHALHYNVSFVTVLWAAIVLSKEC